MITTKECLDLLMLNQKQLKSGHKFTNLKTGEQLNIEDCYEIIKKDLEILEILKKHYDRDSLSVSLYNFISFYIYKNDNDFNKIKEWVEND